MFAALYTPVLFYLLPLATPKFLGIYHPPLYFWLMPLSLAAFALALFFWVNGVRKAAWLFAIVASAWLAEILLRIAYYITKAKLNLNQDLWYALAGSVLHVLQGFIELYFISIPLLITLIFALFFRNSENSP